MCWLFRKLLLVVSILNCSNLASSESEIRAQYRYDIEEWLSDIDGKLLGFNSLTALLTWDLTIDPENYDLSQRGKELTLLKNKWKNDVCDKKINFNWITEEQRRKIFLFCRGGKYENDEIIKFIEMMGELARQYNSEICLSKSEFSNQTQLLDILNHNQSVESKICISGEPDLENLMKRRDLGAEQLKWIWKLWHNSVGPRIKQPFLSVVDLQNIAAERKGYQDHGDVWREELEIPDLERTVSELFYKIKPLYEMLHAVVRHKLLEKYGPGLIDPEGPLPIHLLGNMWGQDWSYLIDLFLPRNMKIELNGRLKSKGFSMKHMVTEAEDFYMSIGWPKMTSEFWKYSVFQKSDNITLCHGSAANLYRDGDFRIMMCGEGNMDDFYVIHHEMGHIHYYMAYTKQPAIFQDGTNTAFHESVGDAIMHSIMTPQHLHRIGLLNDDELLNESTEFELLLWQALEKIPELPFALLIDQYRWKIFRGDISYQQLNEVYWKMNKDLRGIVPPEPRSEEFFDAGAKFHIPDGTPYIRYFLSGIMQMDLFRSLCELTFFGRNAANEYEENALPLQKCDIYGSKKAGKHFRRVLSLGASVHWSTALKLFTNHDYLTVEPLLQYYKPIHEWLKRYIKKHNVIVGW